MERQRLLKVAEADAVAAAANVVVVIFKHQLHEEKKPSFKTYKSGEK